MADIYELTVCDDDATITHEGDPAPNTEAREGYYTFNATKTIGDVSKMYSVNLQVTTSKEFRMPIIGDKITAGIQGNTAFFIGYTSLAVINESKIQITEPGPFIPIGDVTSDFQAINVGKITEMINNKMDRDLGNKTVNISYIIETWHDGTSWYRIWSDGWCEQGGLISSVVQDSYTSATVQLFKRYADTNYYVNLIQFNNGQNLGLSNATGSESIYTKYSDSFVVSTNSWTYSRMWKSEGYLAEGQY